MSKKPKQTHSQLYDLRREETMRQAREWYFREFIPIPLPT